MVIESVARDMPKLDSPFVREMQGSRYLVTPQINPGYEWVFEDDEVLAIEKIHGTNVSVIIQEGVVVAIFNRTDRVQLISKSKHFISEGVQNSYRRGYMGRFTDGQYFGEVVGPKLNENPYNLDEHRWIPFISFARDHLLYKSWGKYPKTYEAISEWFKNLMPLYNLMINGKDCTQEEKKNLFVEGIVFTHPDGRMAKLRKNMFPWYSLI